MSKKIYICKEILASSVSCSGKGNSSVGFGSTATEDANHSINYKPYQVQLYKQNSTPLSGATINAVSDQSARLTNFYLTISNTNTSLTYKTSDYYLLYKNQVTLSFNIAVNYKCNGVTYVDYITASIQGSTITDAGTYPINIYETFNNIKNNAYPLTSLSIDTASPAAISFNDGSTDTSKAIVCMQITNQIKPSSLNGILKTASSTSALFSATIPDTSRAGRVFVTYFEIGEQAFSYCLYSYRGYIESVSEITHYPEPCATNFYRSSSTWYDVFEFDDGEYNSNGTPTYRCPYTEHYAGLVGLQSDTVVSSFDDATIYRPDYHDQDDISTFSSWSTNINWSMLEKISWVDGVLIRLVERGGIGTAYSAWTPLIDAILYGINIPSNVNTIEVEMIVPDLCTLTSNEFTDNPKGVYPSDYTGGFYPYNNLKLHLRLGYQTASLGTTGATYAQKEQGLYCDTSKVRRMIVNSTNEIQYFVVDEEE